MDRSSALNRNRRSQEMATLADGEEVDLLVVGGGITGAGIALDAASRGLSVALIERRDLANGTSRFSSKLIHGGLRYLRHLEMGLAWESARERHLLISKIAPHLVHPLAFVAPLNESLGPTLGLLTEIGVRVGDGLRLAARTKARILPRPRRIDSAEALRLVPGLEPSGLRGGLLFWDGQLEDDARLVITVARTAAAYGAKILTYCRALSLQGRSATVSDEITNEIFHIQAKRVVNATGVWAQNFAPQIHLRPSKGCHVVVDAAALGNPSAAFVVPVLGESARWVGASPIGNGLCIVGVTDDPYEGPIVDEPEVTDAEETFLLQTLSSALATPVTSHHVVSRYAGFRPLLRSEGSSADLSRRHAIVEGEDGVISVVGGKLTTYRRMAQDTVDRIVGSDGPSCVTASLPLRGATDAGRLLQLAAPSRLVARYGTDAALLVEMAQGHPEWLRPISEDSPVLPVELVFGVEYEGAMNLDDLLDRRIRVGLFPRAKAMLQALAEEQVGEALNRHNPVLS